MSAKRVTSEQIIDAYKATGSVWKAGKLLGVAGQTVHKRLVLLQYPLPSATWTPEEEAELHQLVSNGVRLAEIANRLGRPYAGVALKASRTGAKSSGWGNKKLPRGTGWDKASTLRHLKALEAFDGPITRYAKTNGLSTELLVRAVQKHCPEQWTAYVASHSDIPSCECPYCGITFIPLSGKQKFCERQCGERSRVDLAYFGGKRRTTVGLDTSTCQCCGKHTTVGLSSHHVLGKENDPDNEMLVALCRGCHKMVTFLSTRTFVEDHVAWESLISLCVMRRNGERIQSGSFPDTMHVTVEIELYDMDDETP